MCTSSAQLKTPMDPIHGQGLTDIPEGQISQHWWQTNFHSIGVSAMEVCAQESTSYHYHHSSEPLRHHHIISTSFTEKTTVIQYMNA